MHEATYEANVISYDATTGAIVGVIPQLFGLQPMTILPSVARPTDIANITAPANNDRVRVYFQGEDDSPPKWIPQISQLRMGTVTAVYNDFNTVTADLNLGNGVVALAVPALGHVIPVIGDSVWVSNIGTAQQVVVGTVRQTIPYAGIHRLNVNGSMAVAQRAGQSFTSLSMAIAISTTARSLIDNWTIVNGMTGSALTHYWYNGTAGDGVSINFAASGNANGVPCQADSEFSSTLIVQNNTAVATPPTAEYQITYTRIEGCDLTALRWGTSLAQPLTVSFTMNIGAAQTIIVELETPSGYRISRSIAILSGRHRYSITFPGLVTVPITGKNEFGLQLNWWFAAGATFSGGAALNTSWALNPAANTRAVGCGNFFFALNQYNLEGVQAEIGAVATPFEHRSYADELRLCRRYFQRWTQPPVRGVMLQPANAVCARMGMPLPVRMRVAPSLAISGTMSVYDGVNTGTFAALTNNWSTPESLEFDTGATTIAAGSAGTVVRAAVLYQNGTGWIDLTAEL